MFVKARSKQRFGDVKEPYINIDEIISVEVGHESGAVNVKLSNDEEMVVTGEHAAFLMKYLEQNTLH